MKSSYNTSDRLSTHQILILKSIVSNKIGQTEQKLAQFLYYYLNNIVNDPYNFLYVNYFDDIYEKSTTHNLNTITPSTNTNLNANAKDKDKDKSPLRTREREVELQHQNLHQLPVSALSSQQQLRKQHELMEKEKLDKGIIDSLALDLSKHTNSSRDHRDRDRDREIGITDYNKNKHDFDQYEYKNKSKKPYNNVNSNLDKKTENIYNPDKFDNIVQEKYEKKPDKFEYNKELEPEKKYMYKPKVDSLTTNSHYENNYDKKYESYFDSKHVKDKDYEWKRPSQDLNLRDTGDKVREQKATRDEFKLDNYDYKNYNIPSSYEKFKQQNLDRMAKELEKDLDEKSDYSQRSETSKRSYNSGPKNKEKKIDFEKYL